MPYNKPNSFLIYADIRIFFHFIFTCFFFSFLFFLLYTDLKLWPRYFPFLKRISFNISCKACLLAANSLSFCLTKFLYLFHFWRIILQGTELCVRWVFSFNALHMASHTLVACMVSEKSDIILIFSLLEVRYILSLDFSGCFLYLWFFCSLNVTCLDVAGWFYFYHLSSCINVTKLLIHESGWEVWRHHLNVWQIYPYR